MRAVEEGLALLKASPFDAVITDLKLPRMSGVEFLGEVRTRHPGTPVIVITDGVAGMFEWDLLELGAFGYLLKPYAAEEVEAVVRHAVKSGRTRRQE